MRKVTLVGLLILVMMGCSSNEDGALESTRSYFHFAISPRTGSDGDWQNYVLIEVDEHGKVLDLVLDGINRLASATRRELSQTGIYNELEGYNFYDEATLVETDMIGQSAEELPDLLDGISGAAQTGFDSADWSELVRTALANEPIEKGPYLNGAYHAASNEPVEGFIDFVNFVVVYGHIVSVGWNATSEEGQLRYDPVLQLNVDTETASWREQVDMIERHLLEVQDPRLITFDEHGFSLELPGIDIEIETFVSLVVEALTNGPISIEME